MHTINFKKPPVYLVVAWFLSQHVDYSFSAPSFIEIGCRSYISDDGSKLIVENWKDRNRWLTGYKAVGIGFSRSWALSRDYEQGGLNNIIIKDDQVIILTKNPTSAIRIYSTDNFATILLKKQYSVADICRITNVTSFPQAEGSSFWMFGNCVELPNQWIRISNGILPEHLVGYDDYVRFPSLEINFKSGELRSVGAATKIKMIDK